MSHVWSIKGNSPSPTATAPSVTLVGLHQSFALGLLEFEKEVLAGRCRLCLLNHTGEVRGLLALQLRNARLRLAEQGRLDEGPSLVFGRGELVEQPIRRE